MTDKIIGVCGGVGPMAGVALHRLIIEQTLTDGTDQDHPDVYHVSRAHDIPDRTEFLLKGSCDNPADGMFRTLLALARAAQAARRGLVAGIPCNTFHAPVIFNRLKQLMRKHRLDATLVHMPGETAVSLKAVLPRRAGIGLMSTTGTREAGVYRAVLRRSGFSVAETPPATQDAIHDAIYTVRWGLKAIAPATGKARAVLRRGARALCEQGVRAIVLGCSELPLALPENRLGGVLLVDPLRILARALIREACPDKLKPITDP